MFTMRKSISADQLGKVIDLPSNFKGKMLEVAISVEEPDSRNPEDIRAGLEYLEKHKFKGSGITLEESRERRLASL